MVLPDHPPSGLTALVAARARDPAAQLARRAPTERPWLRRGPALVSAALAHAEPPPMAARHDGARDHAWTAASGGGAQRAGRRQTPAPRRVHPPHRPPSP